MLSVQLISKFRPDLRRLKVCDRVCTQSKRLYEDILASLDQEKWGLQGFNLASAIGHSPKIVPDVQEFAVQFGQFVRDDFRKRTLYGYAQ